MTSRRPTTILIAAVVVLILVVGFFAYALLESASSARREVERRFSDRARVSAALTESIFDLTAGQGAEENARRYGAAEIDIGRLEREAKQSRLTFSAVLDASGQILAATAGVTPAVRAQIATGPPAVKAALRGQPWALSDFLTFPGGSGLLQYAAPFVARDGTRRVIVNGFSSQIIGRFLGGYLAGLPDARTANAYVVDSKGLVVGSPVKDQPPGSTVREPGLTKAIASGAPLGSFDAGGQERTFAESEVRNSSWRVVLSAPSSRVYVHTGTTIEWLILAALALAGIVVVWLLQRALGAAVELRLTNRELEHSNRELTRSNAELEQFASVASHDLQEPLRKVQTFGDKLEQHFGDQIPDEAKDYLRRMRRSSARMSALIEDLLRFSRVTTHAAQARAIDLGRVAREVTSDLDAMVQATHGRVVIDDLPTVQADPLQMRQLMQNLIANGLKFHRPGIEPEVRVEPVATSEPGHVAFRVADNGIGFEQQYGERIFRVFERLHPRDVYEGTGIGLALCRKIVERHGGTISASGSPDAGAAFTVTLPATQADQVSLDRRHTETPREHAHA